MAFALYASTGSTTTQLNDKSPFAFESLEGASGAPIIRHEQRSPLQQGATDLGYRVQPRELKLRLLFRASSAAVLDGYRDALLAAFAPLETINTTLSVQRDDGEIRTLTVNRVSDVAIDLVSEDRPGNLHRATLTLRAANPLWKANSVTMGSATFSGLTSWWLAGGAIASGDVKNRYEYPAQAAVTAFAGTVTGDWAVAVVTAKDTAVANAFAWQDSGSASFWHDNSGVFYIHDSGLGGGTAAWPGTTDYNVHVIESRSGTQYWRYWNGTSLVAYINTTGAGFDISLRGADFNWRKQQGFSGNYWTPEIRKAAILQNMSTTQLDTLARYMLDTVQGSIALVNDGDVPAYPVMTLRGPLVDPVIVNTTTGGTLSLTGSTLGSADIWTIDLRDGDKRIYNQNGDSVLGSVTAPLAALAGFSLAPAPTAPGGTNILIMTPGSVGSSAYFSAEIQSRYTSY